MADQPLPDLQEVFRSLLRQETQESGYLSGSKKFLEATSGEPIAWMKMIGLRFEAYVYSMESGEKVVETLKALGAHEAIAYKDSNWHDGEFFMVRGSI